MRTYAVTMLLTLEVQAGSITHARDEAVEAIERHLFQCRPTTSLPNEWQIDPVQQAQPATALARLQKIQALGR